MVIIARVLFSNINCNFLPSIKSIIYIIRFMITSNARVYIKLIFIEILSVL